MGLFKLSTPVILFYFILFFIFFWGGENLAKIWPNFDLKNYDLHPYKGFSMEKKWLKFARS
jgi:hypothetical protein